jgi:hypothetical protein
MCGKVAESSKENKRCWRKLKATPQKKNALEYRERKIVWLNPFFHLKEAFSNG